MGARRIKSFKNVSLQGRRSCLHEELRSNTNFMRELNGLILVQEPFVLDDELRERCERWVDWMNADPENAKEASIFNFGGDE